MLELGSEKRQTKVVPKQLNPVWQNEEHRFALPGPGEPQELVISVWNWNAGRRDDFLGRVPLPVDALLSELQAAPGGSVAPRRPMRERGRRTAPLMLPRTGRISRTPCPCSVLRKTFELQKRSAKSSVRGCLTMDFRVERTALSATPPPVTPPSVVLLDIPSSVPETVDTPAPPRPVPLSGGLLLRVKVQKAVQLPIYSVMSQVRCCIVASVAEERRRTSAVDFHTGSAVWNEEVVLPVVPLSQAQDVKISLVAMVRSPVGRRGGKGPPGRHPTASSPAAHRAWRTA